MTKRVGKNVNKRKEKYKKIYNFYRCSDRFLIFVNIFIHLSEEIKKVSFILQRTTNICKIENRRKRQCTGYHRYRRLYRITILKITFT